jgi:hypothetical protein
MAASSFDGPLFVPGNMSAIPAAMVPGFPVPDSNPDAGPSAFFLGTSLLDLRFWFQKDRVQGFTGTVPAHMDQPFRRALGGIPAALASNNIAAAQGVTSGVAMTLAAASTGVSVNIPIAPVLSIPSASLTSQAIVIAALALDFGFQFGNCTAGNATIPIASSADYIVGMPLVIAGVGNSAGTAPLLTNVTAVAPVTPNTIVVANAPLATNATAAIATGNVWGPSEPVSASAQNALPTAALPWLAIGPGLFLDSRQTINRGVQIVGVSGSTGGTFTVRGWDIYGEPMSQTVTVAAGASTGWSTKCLKYIASVTPNFTDVGHNYTVGTSDTFGLLYRSGLIDDTMIWWASVLNSATTGFVASDNTNPATSLTNDVRGSIQVSANGNSVSGIGTNASNGTISGLSMSGRRLTIFQNTSVAALWEATTLNPATIWGSQQA